MDNLDNTKPENAQVAPQNPTTGSSNKAEIQTWLDKVTRAEKYLAKYVEKYRTKTLIEEYKGDVTLATQQLDIRINPLMLIFAYIKTELAALYLRDPLIKINPKKKATIASAKILEAALNYLWRVKKVKREIKKCIMDAMLTPLAWLKSGYTGSFGTVELDSGKTLDTIESEDFFSYRVPWDCVLFDPIAIDPPYDCKWIAHKVYADLAEVKENPRYKNTASISPIYDKNRNNKDKDKDTSSHSDPLAILYEIWNIKKRTVFTIAEGVDDYIEDPKPWPYDMQGYPFSALKFNFVNDEAYGIPDVYTFEPQVIEKMKIRAAELDHLKRYNRQLMGPKGLFSEDAKNQLALGITGAYIEANENPMDKVGAIPYPPIPQDAYLIEARLDDDMNNIAGQLPSERGGTTKTSTRAFKELSFNQTGVNNRRSEKVDLVEDFIEDVSNNLVRLLQQLATLPYYVRIVGEDSMELRQAIASRPSAQQEGGITNQSGFTFTNEDIKGEFDVEVVAGSSTPIDNIEKTKTIMGIIEILPTMGLAPGGPIYGALARMLGDTFDMPELKQAIEAEGVFQEEARKQISQQQEEMKQMEIAKFSSDKNIDAENAATKQSKIMLQAMQMKLDHESRMNEEKGKE